MPRFPFSSLSVSRQTLKLIRPTFDLKRGLAKSSIFPWLPVTTKSEEVLPQIQEVAPVDGREIVDWMQRAAAEAAVLDGACEDYNRLGSLLIASATDPYLPGMRLGDLSVRSITGADVRSAGGCAVVTPRGNFNVPLPGAATGIFSDILAWANLVWCGSVQWILSLLQWKDLAKTPISDRVRFANVNGYVAPQFATVSPRIPAPLVMMRIGMTSSKPQTVAIKGRGLSDYTGVLFEDSFSLEAGESEVIYNVFGFPFVADFLLHLQPENGTETFIDYLETVP